MISLRINNALQKIYIFYGQNIKSNSQREKGRNRQKKNAEPEVKEELFKLELVTC